MAASVWRFLNCAQMLLHAIAHGGCTDTVRESALEADSGRKIPCRTVDSNPRQYCAWLFSRTLYPLSFPRHWLSVFFYRNVCIICLFIHVLMHISTADLYV